MDFFHSLPLDLKLVAVGIAGFALLALFSGNRNAEKRYVLVLAVLAAVGVYRFNHTIAAEQAQVSAAQPGAVKMAAKPAPLVSTSAK
jgi:hypothetical protein